MDTETAKRRKEEGWEVVSLWLEPDLAQAFREYKKQRGLKHDTEVVRMAIVELLDKGGIKWR